MLLQESRSKIICLPICKRHNCNYINVCFCRVRYLLEFLFRDVRDRLCLFLSLFAIPTLCMYFYLLNIVLHSRDYFSCVVYFRCCTSCYYSWLSCKFVEVCLLFQILVSFNARLYCGIFSFLFALSYPDILFFDLHYLCASKDLSMLNFIFFE